MKKKAFVKIFAISLCLNVIFSTIAMAKEYEEIKQSKFGTSIQRAVPPLPPEAEIPE